MEENMNEEALTADGQKDDDIDYVEDREELTEERIKDMLDAREYKELKEELAEIERMYLSLPATSFYWQQAVVGNNDRIIPPDNQLNAWRKEAEISRKTLRVHYTEDAHYQVELFRYYLQEIWTKD